MNILFFDVVPTNIVRFFEQLIAELRKQQDARFFFLIEEDDHNTLSHVSLAFPFAAFTGYVKHRKVEWFREFMETNRIDALFVNAQRIPDDLAVLSARSLGVPTFMFQHGMYIPFLKRDAKFFLSKFGKSLRFLEYAKNISEFVSGNRWVGVLRYIRCYVFGRNQVDEGIDRCLLNVDRVYVFGDYWKEFHSNQFGYKFEQQLTVGYPELLDLQGIRAKGQVKDSVCYITQTLVEDGRLARRLQEEFFATLVDECFAAKKKLLVKLHPRSDKSLYESAKGKEFVKFLSGGLPFSEKYIGHYSTLIVKGFRLSGDVFVYEYDGHPTPSYFAGLAAGVSSDTGTLRRWLANPAERDIRVDHYFFENHLLYEQLVSDFLEVVSRRS